ncbi:MAG: hypothetical protein HWN66_13830 [Candidatus Helarchaeota archaeon]|nr:hypothetical protein [Candidatus Helarchaeota archaeon]
MVDIIGFFGYFWAFIFFFFNIIVLTLQAKHSYKLKHNESFYSLCLCVGTLVVNLILVLIFIEFDLILSLVVIGTGVIIFSLFGLFNLFHHHSVRRKGDVQEKKLDLADRENVHHEFYRKIYHIILFFGIIAFLTIIWAIMVRLNEKGYDLQELIDVYWGSLDGLGMHVLRTPDYGQAILLDLYIIMTTVFVMNEGARIGNWFYFPLQKLASLGIREKEKETVASYVYFTIGMIFASTFLYPIPLFSIIGILCFADTAASLFGRKYGKHRLQFNKTKSWEGSLAGFLVCLLVTVLFVGPIWGLVASIVFFVIDGITPVLSLSDNIGIPIGVTGAYLLLSFLQIEMHSIVFAGIL